MKNRQSKIASKKHGKRQVVDRIQHPIVRQVGGSFQVINISEKPWLDSMGKKSLRVQVICGRPGQRLSELKYVNVWFREGCSTLCLASGFRKFADMLDKLSNVTVQATARGCTEYDRSERTPLPCD